MDQELRGRGLEVFVSTDFRELAEHYDKPDRGPLTPVFDWRASGIGGADGMWIGAIDSTGDLAMSQAMRVFEFRGTTLAEHLRDNALFYASRDVALLPFESAIKQDDAAGSIKGRVVYHGEVWVAKAHRGGGLPLIFPRLGMTLALLEWSPDFYFGLAREGAAHRGFTIQYGYRHVCPAVVRWKREDGGYLDETLCWTSAEEVADIIARRDLPLAESAKPESARAVHPLRQAAATDGKPPIAAPAQQGGKAP